MSYVLYHADCCDGFGAAWAAWKVLGAGATYTPLRYGQSIPPEITPWDDLYILDFSFPRFILEHLARERGAVIGAPGKVVLLDHHKTAEADLRGLPFATFDLEKSGARLAWEYFHPNTPVPEFVLYLEDRDLWRFVLPQSREVAAALRSYPMDFAVWDGLFAQDQGFAPNVNALRCEGVAILRYQRQLVEAICAGARIWTIGGYRVPVANATACFSEVGERLCALYPEAPFAAYYLDRGNGERQWGLRSRGGFDGFDVSEVAKRLGGGGHPAAAGFIEALADEALNPGVPMLRNAGGSAI